MITEPNVESNADEDKEQPLADGQPKASTSSSSPTSQPQSSSSSDVRQPPACAEPESSSAQAQPTAIANPGQEDASDLESTYHLKWIPWNSGKIPIVMQSINGPCPLIATMNVLLLREKVKLPQMLEQITATQLLTYIGECIMDSVSNPSELVAEQSNQHAAASTSDDALLNLEQNIHDAMEILPKLKTGLDVNIRFTGITDFEYTPECIIFDLLRIPLYHGWLCDPNLLELTRAINTQSYNQLVDMIITNKTSQDPERLLNVFIAEEFLENTASQLTLHGLSELRTKIKDNEIGILFRNNHFLTLFKRENVIYTLVTDHGYLTEDNIIWETLDSIEGAGRFMDSNFQLAETTNRQVSELNAIDQRQQQLENDFLMALSLKAEESLENQQQQQQQQQQTGNDTTTTRTQPVTSSTTVANLQDLDDFELAKRLQDEENQIYEELMRQRQTQTAGSDQRLALVPAESHQQQSRDANIRSNVSNFQSRDEFPPLAPSATSTAPRSNDAQALEDQTRAADQQLQQLIDSMPTSSDGTRLTHRKPGPTTIATSRSQDDLSAQHAYNRPGHPNHHHHQQHQQLRTSSASSNGGRRSRTDRTTKDSNCSIS